MAAQEEDVDDGWGQVPQSLEQIEDWMKAGGKSLANSSSVGEPSQMDVLNEILLDEAEQKTLAAEWKVILAKADASSIHRKQTARILHLETKVEEYQWRIKDMILEKKLDEMGNIGQQLEQAEAERRARQVVEAEQALPKKWKMVDTSWVRA